MIDIDDIRSRFRQAAEFLDERGRRLFPPTRPWRTAMAASWRQRRMGSNCALRSGLQLPSSFARLFDTRRNGRIRAGRRLPRPSDLALQRAGFVQVLQPAVNRTARQPVARDDAAIPPYRAV